MGEWWKRGEHGVENLVAKPWGLADSLVALAGSRVETGVNWKGTPRHLRGERGGKGS